MFGFGKKKTPDIKAEMIPLITPEGRQAFERGAGGGDTEQLLLEAISQGGHRSLGEIISDYEELDDAGFNEVKRAATRLANKGHIRLLVDVKI